MLIKNYEIDEQPGYIPGLHVPKSGKSGIQRTVRFRCVAIFNYICNIL